MSNIPGVDTLLLHRRYSHESMVDVERDIYELLDDNPKTDALPKDEYGFCRGTFHVMVV